MADISSLNVEPPPTLSLLTTALSDLRASDPSMHDHRVLLLSEIKRLHRELNMHMERTYNNTFAAKLSLDALALQYQSLLREKEYVLKEMHICREGIKYVQHDLVELDEFMTNAPEALRTQEIVEDPHRLHLSRLVFERQQRLAMTETLKALRQKKQALITSNNEKQALLKSVGSHLDKILAASAPLRKQIGLPRTVLIPDAKLSTLSEPLYTLMVSLSSYSSAFSDSLVDSRIEENVSPFSVTCDSINFVCDPAAIHVTIKDASIASGLDLSFSSATPGPVVFVRGGGELLVDLYPQDSGNTFPNSMEFITDVPARMKDFAAVGVPYRWAQSICGIHNHIGPIPLIRNVVTLIRERMRSHVQLQRHIAALEAGEIKIPVNVANRFPLAAVCRLSSFRATQSPRLFEAVFEHPYGNTSMAAFIDLLWNHPVRSPSARIVIESKDPTVAHDNVAFLIESEIKRYFEANTTVQSVSLPIFVRFLQMCLDISMSAIFPSTNGDARLFLRARRGRDRRIPFEFDSDIKCFCHNFNS